MLEKGRISCTQTVYLLINLVGATAVIFLPAITAVHAGRSSWISPLLATIPGIYLAVVIHQLGKRFPGRTLMEYLQIALGAWTGKLVGILYIFFFLHTNGVIIREFGELLVSLVLPQTPLMVLHSVILLLCAWAVRGGIEVLGRVMEFSIPVILFLFMVTLVLTVGEMKFENLLPVMDKGFLAVIHSSLDPIAWRGEIILFAMFLPFLSSPGTGGRCAVIAVIAIGLILSVDAIANTAVFGEAVARMTFPTFSLVRMVSVAMFFERIESVLVAIWVIGMFGKISIFYYASVLGAAQLANMRDYRPLVLPVGVILAAMSIQTAGSATELVEYIVLGFPPFAFIFEYIIPTLLLGVAVIRGIKGEYPAGGEPKQ